MGARGGMATRCGCPDLTRMLLAVVADEVYDVISMINMKLLSGARMPEADPVVGGLVDRDAECERLSCLARAGVCSPSPETYPVWRYHDQA